MLHKPIQCHDISLSFAHKICFENFSTQILHGSRIAIIGRNGSGKSHLLNLLRGTISPSSGSVTRPADVRIGYIPQVIADNEHLSGGQRVQAALNQALSAQPNVLLLDEPTNHLDVHHKKSLLRMLRAYTGTLIVVSHDLELLHNDMTTLWHIDNARIAVFRGNYVDYMRECDRQRLSLAQELVQLKQQKKALHLALMQEQTRAAKSRTQGEKSIAQRKWPTVVSRAKAHNAQQTSGHKKRQIQDKKHSITTQLAELPVVESIVPTFNLHGAASHQHRVLVSISEGSVAYREDHPVLRALYLTLAAGERIALIGDNGSGKSTLLKALMGQAVRSGEWQVPALHALGYLDQHYQTLVAQHSVWQNLQALVPSWPDINIRRHLNDFLFRQPEEINALVSTLSGGEKARLALAQIAAATPQLLLLDEVTNNLDLVTRAHVITVLQKYPGSLIVIAHDRDFLQAINIERFYHIKDGVLIAD